MSSSMIIASKSSDSESKTARFHEHQFSAMSEHSPVKGTPQHIREWLMSLPQDSHVNHSVSVESVLEKRTSETCGPPPSQSFAQYDHATSCWRTSQVCLLTDTCSEFSAIWPKAGLMRSGVCWEVKMWGAYRTAKDCGLSLLRPTAQCWKAWTFKRLASLIRKNHSDGNIQEQSARCFHKMITPESNEILMLWPEGWSDLKPLEMDKWAQWLQEHGEP